MTPNQVTTLAAALSYWNTLVRGIPGFFEPNAMAFWRTHVVLGADRAGYYSTDALEKTLSELVDFSIVNRCRPRLTVGAAHLRRSLWPGAINERKQYDVVAIFDDLPGWRCHRHGFRRGTRLFSLPIHLPTTTGR